MTVIEAIILGLVQGATEFLPVSSSGHLVIVQELLGVVSPGVVFEVVVHLATLISILVAYRSRVADLAVGALGRDPASLRYIGLVVVATIPAGLVGVLFKDSVEALFENPVATGVALLVTGIFLWSSRTPLRRTEHVAIGVRAAVLIGLAQAVALVPGISRSGTTVVAALWLGLEAREAAAFSFMMAIPAIAGAAVLQIPDLVAGGGPGVSALVVGGIVAAVSGVLAIRTLIAMLARKSFPVFAIYCWIAGTAFLSYLALR
jgi:undecaprenyl-diphosphatase